MEKVLVIVDMQNDFITGCLGNKECEKVVPKIVELVKSGTYAHVFLTKDTHHDSYLDTEEGKKLPVPHCIRETEGWEINPDIMFAVKSVYEEKNITIIEKETFGSLILGETLKTYCEKSDNQVEIDFVGVCTGICVISNVLIAKASCPEEKICVIEQACACVTPESHKNAIEAMKTTQVDII